MNDEEQALSEKVDLMGPVFILLGNLRCRTAAILQRNRMLRDEDFLTGGCNIYW